MTDTILTINAGSSSVKFSLFANDETLSLLAHGGVEGLGAQPILAASEEQGEQATRQLTANATHEDGLRTIIDWIQGHAKNWRIAFVAHRIVHGGTEFTKPVQITSDIFHNLKSFIPLAPLHQPHNLLAVGIIDRLLAHVPQIACFDTAFHTQHEPIFSQYALPKELTEKGVRRYGFHGLSYEWIAQVLRRDHPELAKGRVVVAHLGNGASLCAIKNGQSIDTTMGMTALDGVPMGSRSGAIDPGAVIYMLRDLHIAANELEKMLYEQSGLKGLSGISNDVKTLLQSRDPQAAFALDFFALRVAQYAAMMAVAMDGVDAFVFTGGIGENAIPVRDKILNHLAFFGQAPSLVIPANEERMMAMHVREASV